LKIVNEANFFEDFTNAVLKRNNEQIDSLLIDYVPKVKHESINQLILTFQEQPNFQNYFSQENYVNNISDNQRKSQNSQQSIADELRQIGNANSQPNQNGNKIISDNDAQVPKLRHEESLNINNEEDEKPDIERKIFIVYENQRYWLLRNAYTHTTFGKERGPWSDAKGQKLTKEEIQLPGPGWVWEDDWQVMLSPNTDKQGWSFAEDFESAFHPQNNMLDLVRKRRWVRCAVKVK